MTYSPELDDYRQQVRRGSGSTTLVYWPKVAGQNVLVDASPAPARTIYSPSGVVLSASSPLSPTTTASISRLDISVSGSTYDLGEDYLVEISFYASAVAYYRQLRFDVLVSPFQAIDELSINDMLDEYPDARRHCTRQALAQLATRTPEDQATIMLSKAWRDVRNWLRKKIDKDHPGQRFVSLLTSKEDLRPPIVALAISYLFRGDGAESKAQLWREQAEARFSEMPTLRFDSDETGTVDTEIGGWTSFDVSRAR